MTGSEGLVRLGKSAQVGERVGAELVEDTRYELGELLGLASASDGEGVGAKGTLDWGSARFWSLASREGGRGV